MINYENTVGYAIHHAFYLICGHIHIYTVKVGYCETEGTEFLAGKSTCSGEKQCDNIIVTLLQSFEKDMNLPPN